VAKRDYEIVPDIRLLETIGEANYTIPEAVGELIANCFDARHPNTKMNIQVEVSPTQITISDNGIGMDERVLSESLRLAVQMDQIRGTSASRKGTYGLGMKAACSSLGKNWTISTKMADSDEYYFLEIDLKKWNSQKDRAAWKVSIDSEKWKKGSGPLGYTKHGTQIAISNLKDNDPMISAIVHQLSMAYKPHLEQGDVISVNGTEVLPMQYNLIDNKKFEINEKIGNHVITGWYGLDIKTHNDNFYGINIYKESQLVESWNKDFIRAHLMNSRVVGEVNSTIFQANFHKKGLQKNTEDWKQVKALMSELLRPAMKASGAMAQNKHDNTRQAKAMQALEGALGNANAAMHGAQDSIVPGNEEAPQSSGARDKSKVIVGGSHTNLQVGDEEISISYIFTPVNDNELPWGYIFDDGKNDLQAIVNTNSDIWRSIKDEKMVGILAAAEAVVCFLIDKRGYTFNSAWEIRNKWLTLSLRTSAKSAEAVK